MADRRGSHRGVTEYPRSGVSGLTPHQVRFRLLGNGWAVLPIVRHDLAKKSAGKKPSIFQWERFAAYNADLPTLDDLHLWEGNNRRAPGTGIATGDLVAVDLDFLHDPTIAKR